MSVLRPAQEMDGVLRGSLASDHAWWVGPRLVLLLGPIAGLGVGSYDALGQGRGLFLLYASMKLPLLVLLSCSVCLPAYFVCHVVLGERERFGLALRGVLRSQALFVCLLASCAPLMPVWYSAAGYRAGLVGVAALFALASVVSMIELVRTRHRHRLRSRAQSALTVLWVFLHGLVAIQLAWTLRPFVGAPGEEASFLRHDAFTNGYVVVAKLLFGG